MWGSQSWLRAGLPAPHRLSDITQDGTLVVPALLRGECAAKDQSTRANQVVWRIHVLGSHTFGNQSPHFLLREIDCRTRIVERCKLFGIGRDFMQNCYDNLAFILMGAANHGEGFVLRHASL
jgi:hypothetical protein